MVQDHEIPNRAPRVTPVDIEAEIAAEYYFRADDGVYGQRIGEGQEAPYDPPVLEPVSLLTFCVLVLKNGYTIVGKSACASPENFDATIGQRIAREDALKQIWPLLGFRLRDTLTMAKAMLG